MSEWAGKGATLTDGTACKEYGLAPDDIVNAIKAGELQWRHASIRGNPCLRLLRDEVEALVQRMRGADYLRDQIMRTELAQVELELKRLKKQLVEAEQRRARLMASMGERTR